MSFLLDPKFWLAFVIWTVIVAAGGYYKGESVEHAAAEVRELKIDGQAQDAKIAMDAETIARSRRFVREMDNRDAQYHKEAANAQYKTDRLIADLRADAVRMSVPVRALCQAGAAGDPGAAGGIGGETRAELTGEAASTLEAIAADGDKAIRKHAEVVDRYDLLRQECSK